MNNFSEIQSSPSDPDVQDFLQKFRDLRDQNFKDDKERTTQLEERLKREREERKGRKDRKSTIEYDFSEYSPNTRYSSIYEETPSPNLSVNLSRKVSLQDRIKEDSKQLQDSPFAKHSPQRSRSSSPSKKFFMQSALEKLGSTSPGKNITYNEYDENDDENVVIKLVNPISKTASKTTSYLESPRSYSNLSISSQKLPSPTQEPHHNRSNPYTSPKSFNSSNESSPVVTSPHKKFWLESAMLKEKEKPKVPPKPKQQPISVSIKKSIERNINNNHSTTGKSPSVSSQNFSLNNKESNPPLISAKKLSPPKPIPKPKKAENLKANVFALPKARLKTPPKVPQKNIIDTTKSPENPLLFEVISSLKKSNPSKAEIIDTPAIKLESAKTELRKSQIVKTPIVDTPLLILGSAKSELKKTAPPSGKKPDIVKENLKAAIGNLQKGETKNFVPKNEAKELLNGALHNLRRSPSKALAEIQEIKKKKSPPPAPPKKISNFEATINPHNIPSGSNSLKRSVTLNESSSIAQKINPSLSSKLSLMHEMTKKGIVRTNSAPVKSSSAMDDSKSLKLDHKTKNRVKGPRRRLPSSLNNKSDLQTNADKNANFGNKKIADNTRDDSTFSEIPNSTALRSIFEKKNVAKNTIENQVKQVTLPIENSSFDGINSGTNIQGTKDIFEKKLEKEEIKIPVYKNNSSLNSLGEKKDVKQIDISESNPILGIKKERLSSGSIKKKAPAIPKKRIVTENSLHISNSQDNSNSKVKIPPQVPEKRVFSDGSIYANKFNLESRSLDNFFNSKISHLTPPSIDAKPFIESNHNQPLSSEAKVLDIWRFCGDTQKKISDLNSNVLHVDEIFVYKTSENIFAWIGPEVKDSEKDKAIILARSLAKEGQCTLLIIPLGKETNAFLSLFGGVVITLKSKGNKDDETNKISKTGEICICVRSTKEGCVFADEVRYSPENLCSGYSYLIRATNGSIYQWVGIGSSELEQKTCFRVAEILEFENIISIKEDPEGDSRILIFEPGTLSSYANSGYWKLKSNSEYETRLFLIQSSGGNIIEISPFTQNDLSSLNIYFLDCYFETYIIVGASSGGKVNDLLLGIKFAESYIKIINDSKSRKLPISVSIILPPSYFPINVKAMFRSWSEDHCPTIKRDISLDMKENTNMVNLISINDVNVQEK